MTAYSLIQKLCPYVISKKSFPVLIIWYHNYSVAVLCPWARHFTPRKYWLITQEAMAPSRHDWKIVDWDVKPQHNQPTNNYSDCPIISPNYTKYNFVGCQMDFCWGSTSYVYTTEKWKRNCFTASKNEYWTYVLTTTSIIIMHVNKPFHEFDQ